MVLPTSNLSIILRYKIMISVTLPWKIQYVYYHGKTKLNIFVSYWGSPLKLLSYYWIFTKKKWDEVQLKAASFLFQCALAIDWRLTGAFFYRSLRFFTCFCVYFVIIELVDIYIHFSFDILLMQNMYKLIVNWKFWLFCSFQVLYFVLHFCLVSISPENSSNVPLIFQFITYHHLRGLLLGIYAAAKIWIFPLNALHVRQVFV